MDLAKASNAVDASHLLIDNTVMVAYRMNRLSIGKGIYLIWRAAKPRYETGRAAFSRAD